MIQKIPGVPMKKRIMFYGCIIATFFLIGCERNYQSHFDLGKWYSEKGLINEAILEFKAATEANPEFYEAHHQLAIAYTKKGWYEYALKEAEMAFDLHPSDETYRLIQIIREKRSLASYEAIISNPNP
jgi:tetratricopeptide (TPR) repeat protein